jgi:hypothetical protein
MIDIQSIPAALKEGENWQLLDIDPDWMWVAYDDDENIVGFLIACNCHGLAMIWRLRMLKSAPPTSLLKLLRRFIKDVRRRGCVGYMAMLDLTRPEEQALARIAFRAKALYAPGCVSVIAGTINTGHLAEGDSCPR